MTKTQLAALVAAWKKNGAWHGRRGGLMGGSYRRMCRRMSDEGLLDRVPPYAITRKGMQKLRDAYHARWAKRGCMAYQEELNEVEAALAAFGVQGSDQKA